MSSLVIKPKQIVAAVGRHLLANLTVATAVEYQGTFLDADALDDWVEVRVKTIKRPAQRKRGKDLKQVLIGVGCFAKRTTNIYRALELGEDVTNQLQHAEIVIRDFEESGEPRLGGLRCFEPKVSNDTRDFNRSNRSDVRAYVIECHAFVQQD